MNTKPRIIERAKDTAKWITSFGQRPAQTCDTYISHVQHLHTKGEERARAVQHAKGKKTARERISLLLDPGTFHEIGRFAGGNIDEDYLGSGVVTGFGEISGRAVAIIAQDFSVRGEP